MKAGLMFLAGISMMLFGCTNSVEAPKQVATAQSVALESEVLTKTSQQAMTPEQVLSALKEGNARFQANNLTPRDYQAQVKKTTDGQFPKAVILSCIDSRVPVEHVFDMGVGDVFVGRVAGNVVNADMLGSMEYACKVAGSKLVVVLGHEHCGAVKSAIQGVELGNITELLSKVKPAILSSGQDASVDQVIENNVRNSMDEIRAKSPILSELEANGEIQIVGGVYDLDNGEVRFLN